MELVSLTRHLDSLAKAALERLGAFVPGAQIPRSAPRDVMATRLGQAILEPSALRQFWADLSDLERAAASAAIHDPLTPSILDCGAFLSKHGRLPRRDSRGMSTYFEAATATRAALLFTEEYAVPIELARALLPLAPPPYGPVAQVFDHPPKIETHISDAGTRYDNVLTEVHTEAHAFHDVLATLRMIEAGRLKVNPNTRSPAQATLKALNGALSLPEYPGTEGALTLRADDAIRTYSLITLAIAAGWAAAGGDGGELRLTERGAAFVRQPDADMLRTGFLAWRDYPGFDEMLRISGLRGAENAMAVYGTRPSIRRSAVLNTLAQAPAGKWFDVEGFFRATRISGNTFEVEIDYISHLWTGDYGGANSRMKDMDGETYWRVVKCQLSLAILFGPLASFGVIDIAYLPPRRGLFYPGLFPPGGLGRVISQHDVLRFIRLTALGEYLLGRSARYAAPVSSGPALRILPNRQIVLGTRLAGTRAGHPVLSKFCDKVSDDVYAFAPAKLIKTIEEGDMSTAEIAAYLERESRAALPQTVRVMLDDVARRSAQVEEAGEASLFRVPDSALALLLEHDGTLRKMGCRRAVDWLVVPAGKTSAFRRRLRDLGYGVAAA
ncbi:MAG: hypothetical protein ABIQ99_00460 [Thermoflexales bacterium]